MKRFTETTIWEEDWFLDMPKEYMLFWFYLKDKCNHAGVWRPNLKLFEATIGVKIDLKTAIEYFNKDKLRCEILKSGHWFLVDFFVFQYGSTFNALNRVHKSIQDIYNQENINLTSIRGLKDLKEGVKDKDKDKEKDIPLFEEEVKEEKIDFINSIIESFLKEYKELRGVDYVVTNSGKERAAAAKILKLYKEKYPYADSNTTLEGLTDFFNACLCITDNWLNENMSLSIIINQFNKITSILKNGNKRTKGQSATSDAELAGIFAKHFATDYPGK